MYLIHWNAMIRNAFLKIRVFSIKKKIEEGSKDVCRAMHSAFSLRRENSRMNLGGSSNGNEVALY